MSQIVDFYYNKTLFITGCTGFLGKCIVEKLLRVCNVKCIYLLIRTKQSITPENRIIEYFNVELFDMLKIEVPDYKNKIFLVSGDLMDDCIIKNQRVIEEVYENVDIVFHVAANVKFDAPLNDAINMNVLGTKKIVELCKNMKKNKVLVYCSTAYSNCDHRHVKEEIYNVNFDIHKFLQTIEWMDKEMLTKLTKNIIKNKPNTYTFSKYISEKLVEIECRDTIPFIIIRPSIIGCTYNEPLKGWNDSFNGPALLFPSIGCGMLQSMMGNKKYICDLVPVDIVSNLIIVSAWFKCNLQNEINVIHCTTGQKNKFTWGMFERYSYNNFINNPFSNVILPPYPSFTKSKFIKYFRTIVEQYIPLSLIDLFLIFFSKKLMFLKLQNKIQKHVNVLEFFTSNEWVFETTNICTIISNMNNVDKNFFNIDVRNINWENYIHSFCNGTKKYLLKEDVCNRDYLKIKIKM